MMPLIRFMLVVLACCLGPVAVADGGELFPVGDRSPAPDFALAGPDGRIHRLSDYKGHPVILNFWATWCPPCRAEMPSMERAHRRLAPEGIAVIAINVGDDETAIRTFLKEMPVTFPLPMDRDSAVARQYPLIGLPMTFVIDPEGRLIYSATGEQTWDAPTILDQVRALAR